MENNEIKKCNVCGSETDEGNLIEWVDGRKVCPECDDNQNEIP